VARDFLIKTKLKLLPTQSKTVLAYLDSRTSICSFSSTQSYVFLSHCSSAFQMDIAEDEVIMPELTHYGLPQEMTPTTLIP